MARPPLLPDSAVLTVIHELRNRYAVLTGTRVRDELQLRFGQRGGVTRMYRLLRDATAPIPLARPAAAAAPIGTDSIEQLRAELSKARERAELAEFREETHQTRWAGEVHSLREQVRALRDAGHRLPILEQQLRDRSRELAAAYKRISDLEAQLEP
jgi:hypothetical protein